MLKAFDFSPPAYQHEPVHGSGLPDIRMRTNREKSSNGKPAGQHGSEEEEKEDKQIICFNCRHMLTVESLKTEKSGKHSHSFTNPGGTSFDLRCFSEAPGCETKGVPIPDFTWFPGYKWCFAFCSNCSVQSGWFYLSSNDSFFGLIREAFI
ncbi:MAG: cereblon family protein [Acidobacteriota bacterium]